LFAEWPPGVDRIILDETDSTNAEAMRCEPPAWVLAYRQTAARGRRGRRWQMPKGNFAASLALVPDMEPARAALYSFVASLALYDVLAELTELPLTLKWPNDVLAGAGKAAGILIESAGSGSRLDRLVVGFGVNLIKAPDKVEDGAVPPASLGLDVGVEPFLGKLAPAFAAREATFLGEGFAPIRDAWLSRAARLGQPIVVRTSDDSRAGVFKDIDPDGALVLGTADGNRTVTAADIFF
jgi:BirA family biotin operon repressor/biotin-[acetyl-CoA-carboxylase] ligase